MKKLECSKFWAETACCGIRLERRLNVKNVPLTFIKETHLGPVVRRPISA